MSGIEITQADYERADSVGTLTMERRRIVAEEFARHRHEARAEALEEAAKVAEDGGRSGRTTMLAQEIRTLHDAVMAIRALYGGES